MKTKMSLLAAAFVVAAAVAPLAARAQSAAGPAPSVRADDSLYQQLGQTPGLVRLMDDFVARLDQDPRTAPFFRDANRKRLKEQLVDQVCQLSGGPCQYKGADMKAAHANFDIRKADFHALVEVLEDAMDAQAIPFGAQKRLLALLAPIHRDAITVR